MECDMGDRPYDEIQFNCDNGKNVVHRASSVEFSSSTN